MGSPSSPAVAARSRRRRGRGGRWALLVILLILIGRGLGLAGNETKPDGGAEQHAKPDADVGSKPQPDDVVSPAPIAEASPRPAPGPAGYDPDRFASLRSALECNTRDGNLGAALATLQHMRALPLDAAQRAALLPTSDALEQSLAKACADVVACLSDGRALAAHDALARQFRDRLPLAEPYVDSALHAAGLPPGLLRPLARGDAVVPVARALARGREVRIADAARAGTGTVVDARSDQVTVRVQTANGWSFPTVPSLACEPVQPTGDEAIEMGLLAVHAHDALLARLWLAIARLRCRGGLPARGDVLAALLP